MFKNPSKILAHTSSIRDGSFVTPEYIITKQDDIVRALNRTCPHRFYPIGEEGEVVSDITCKLHGFSFDRAGDPLNNNCRLGETEIDVGQSGLIFENFEEPNHKWVDDVKKETNLVYSNSYTGTSHGSWLWSMEMGADLLHVRKGGIHPWLYPQINLDDVILDQEDNWMFQGRPDGWWTFVFPYTFIEWSPGCLSINYTVPKNVNIEYGFDWITQMYFDPLVPIKERDIFQKINMVFIEDVEGAEKIKLPYHPLKTSTSRFEDQCVYFGQWVKKNRIDDKS